MRDNARASVPTNEKIRKSKYKKETWYLFLLKGTNLFHCIKSGLFDNNKTI